METLRRYICKLFKKTVLLSVALSFIGVLKMFAASHNIHTDISSSRDMMLQQRTITGTVLD